MLKKRIVSASICIIFALFVSECFAIDKLPSARSGEIVCIGGDSADSSHKMVTNFAFRNVDPVHAISFTKIRLYTESGVLVASLLPPNFPSSFKETIGPSSMAVVGSTDLLNGAAGGRLTLKINFAATDGALALAPHGLSGLIDTATDGTLLSRDTVECAYTVISAKALQIP